MLAIAFMGLMLTSCEKYNYLGNDLGGAQSPIGEVGNTFSISGVDGISNISCKISDLADGISTIYYTCKIDRSDWVTMAQYIPGSTITGNTIISGGQAKITENGIMNVYDEGNLLLVNYNTASVGDKYSLKTGGRTIEREVTAKSTEDDFFWGWMLIKTIDIEETGRGIPGVNKVTYFTNHKFGLVGLKVEFEDGSVKQVGIYSTNSN
jgi:hypothetical protein